MAYSLDIKSTIWERLEFRTEEQMLEVKSKLESGELKTALDIVDYVYKDNQELHFELLYDTQEFIDPSENGGCSTIEIQNEEGELIFKNANI
jgi:hypothetical protein